jgi:hypothetical protein
LQLRLLPQVLCWLLRQLRLQVPQLRFLRLCWWLLCWQDLRPLCWLAQQLLLLIMRMPHLRHCLLC